MLIYLVGLLFYLLLINISNHYVDHANTLIHILSFAIALGVIYKLENIFSKNNNS